MVTAAKPTSELTRLDPVANIRLGFFVAFRVNLRDLTCARRWWHKSGENARNANVETCIGVRRLRAFGAAGKTAVCLAAEFSQIPFPTKVRFTAALPVTRFGVSRRRVVAPSVSDGG